MAGAATDIFPDIVARRQGIGAGAASMAGRRDGAKRTVQLARPWRAKAVAVTVSLGLGSLLLLVAPVDANAQATPAQNGAIHMGATTCGASNCHGSDHPRETASVAQTEFNIWSQQDAHSKAYAVLGSDRARRIAGNLGIGSPQQTTLCLGCHTDLTAVDRRSPTYKVSDGVDCEACHGAASEFLGPHVSGLFSHQEHIAAGMYPTADPQARGKLCLSCHFGAGDKFVSHRLIAAGHPRLQFELDTFTASEPAHFRPTVEYRQRKGQVTGIRDWVIGQAAVAHAMLSRLADPARNHDGLLPELALFDCFDCHRPIVVGASASAALPRVNLASVAMLRIAASAVAPGLAGALEGGAAQVNGAVVDNAEPGGAAGGLEGAVRRAEAQLAAYHWDRPARLALLHAFAQAGRAGRFDDFIEAEQATFGIAAVLAEMTAAGDVAEAQFREPLAHLYAAVGKAQAYRSDVFVGAVNAVVRSVDRGEVP
jgi:hypothetical protein